MVDKEIKRENEDVRRNSLHLLYPAVAQDRPPEKQRPWDKDLITMGDAVL